MSLPAVSLFFSNQSGIPPSAQLYPKMNIDIVNRNLAQISFFVNGVTLKSSHKYGEIKIPKERGWYRRFRSSPQLDPAAVERTYEIALQIKGQPEKEKVFLGIKANFEASLKGLDRLVNHFANKDPVKAELLKTIQTKILTTLAEQEIPEMQLHLDGQIAVTTENHVPPPPPPPSMERIMPKKPQFKRRPQSVCLVSVDLERDFMNELFAKIKIKSPIKEIEPIIPEESSERSEWDEPVKAQEPVLVIPMTTSTVRHGLQRTVSYYDKRTPLYMAPNRQQDINLIRSAVASRRLSMRGKGFSD